MPAVSIADLPAPPAGKTGWPWTEGSSPLPEAMPDGGPWPRVSVVTPSFNQGRFIEETIRSVLLQGYPELELIVMDGGSRDETVEVLRRYDRWIAHWASERDRGQTHAINKGLALATGELFAYLNSDDVFEPDAVGRVVEAFRRHPGADVVHGECVYTDEQGVELYSVRGKVDGYLHYLRIWDRLQAEEFLTQPEVFCRTAAVRDAGGFREELRSVMDLEMWLRLLARGCRFQAVDARVARFRTYVAQKSSVDPGGELCAVVEEYILRDHESVTPAVRMSLLDELERARAHLLVRGGIAATLMGSYPQAVRYCFSALLSYPRIAATYPFWAVLAHPVRRRLPAPYRRTLRRILSPVKS